ncbi:MAG: DUF1249 domain-containing protein [endosymbiont of Galathealinum brachiosum]|uniref:DUF1249 domain-containing protein n=1 Tax=endosymbiont of Galathealinum brachiosum TaxID=2200906 RepID=A0A370DGA6_9GAMM|nr:MAG: DUF1249 domain-containing protein [endosymbiont of Galathealinum brachiosum]
MSKILKNQVIENCKQKTSQYGCEDVQPVDFVSLMDMYEDNYIKIRKLIPGLQQIKESAISESQGHLNLHLNIVERSKFTTTLRLSYCFADNGETRLEPNLKIRIYQDAGLAEVMSGKLHHGRLVLDHLPADALREKWQLNRFLSKWLKYCLRQKHVFLQITDTVADISIA